MFQSDDLSLGAQLRIISEDGWNFGFDQVQVYGDDLFVLKI